MYRTPQVSLRMLYCTFETKTKAMMNVVPMNSPTVKTAENLFLNPLSVYVDNRVLASTILVM